MSSKRFRWWITRLLLLAIPVAALAAFGGSAAANGPSAGAPTSTSTSSVSSSSLGTYSPTFTGSAATGCANGCHLLSGPYPTAAVTSSSSPAAVTNSKDTSRALPSPLVPRPPGETPNPASGVTIPTVSCQPLGAGCDTINTDAAGAVGVKGLNAVDSAKHTPNIFKDVEPPDQGLCAGNGSIVETNNIAEMLVFNTTLNRTSSPISLDKVMGLGKRGWSSGGDPSCLYDHANGGHWFITEIVSASPESKGGPFDGCFVAAAYTCYEGIAVTTGNNPLGPYNVYFLKADYNPSEPGYPYLLNDFAKISTTRDAFLMFYDEFPLNPNAPGFGGGMFNGAQQFAFNKNAFEHGLKVTNPSFTVARENMGLLPTPDGTCFRDNKYHEAGVACWVAVIPAQPPDPSQYDNSHGGSGFMLDTVDFYSNGGNQLAVWDWTGLDNLNSSDCSSCSGIRFGGQLFSGVAPYYNPSQIGVSAATPYQAPQKAGPIPLGDECGQAGLSSDAHCPEGPIQTNGDSMTQASQANGQLWAGTSTEVVQDYSNPSYPVETHAGAVYWVVGTSGFDSSRTFTLTDQGYVSPMHEDVEYPTMAAEGTPAQDGGDGLGIMSFTLNGNGGPSFADNGGFYPSSAYGRVSTSSHGLSGSVADIADLGQSPQDGFTEYQGYPGPIRPRWGDYGAAQFLPFSGGKIYFASEYIQYPNCMPPAFTLTIGTCGGTRDGFANWGTSVNYVVP